MKDAALKVLYLQDNQLLAGGMHAGKVMKGGWRAGPFFPRALCTLRGGPGRAETSRAGPRTDAAASTLKPGSEQGQKKLHLPAE